MHGSLFSITTVMIIASFSINSCSACQRHVSLFMDTSNLETAMPHDQAKTLMQSDDLLKAAKRYRLVEINPQVLDPEKLNLGDKLCLSLFKNVEYLVTIEKKSIDINNVLALRGIPEGTSSGFFILSADDGKVEASIVISEKNKEYSITYVPALNRHILLEVNPEKKDVLPDGPILMPPLTQ